MPQAKPNQSVGGGKPQGKGSSESDPSSPAAADVKPAQPASAWDHLRGKPVGRYKVIQHLDTGGMAEIFLASNEGASGFRKELVIKLLQSRYQDNPAVMAMFRDEARIGARLNHPAIVDIYDAAEHQGQPFIAMEYIEGRILTQLIRRGLEVGRPLPLGVAAFICAQVAEGLAYMYGGRDSDGTPLAVVHRDISPTNIIISDRGHTKIIDFGIATDHGDRKEDWEGRAGKYSYMSPEQVQGLPLDGRSDVFSLGIILYEITLGRRLYRGKPQVIMKRIVEEQIRPPTFTERDYPPALEKIVMKALAKRPEDRYGSADELGRDLDQFLASLPDRIGDRQVAEHVAAIESPQAAVSSLGQRRADAFVGEDDDFNEEALDFDRGAAGGWRVAVVEAPPAPAPAPLPAVAWAPSLGLRERAAMAEPVVAAPQPTAFSTAFSAPAEATSKRRSAGPIGAAIIAALAAAAGVAYALIR